MGQLSAEQLAIADNTQDMVLKAISTHKSDLCCQQDNFLDSFRKLDEDKIRQLFGDVGRRVKLFVDQVEFSHPDLMDFINLIPNINTFRSKVLEVLSNKEEGGREEINSVFQKVVRYFDRPKPRLLKDQSRRDTIRSDKKYVKHINLKNLYVSGENCFYTKPETFGSYVCQSEEWKNTLSLLKKQQIMFESRGLKEIATVYQKRSVKLEEEANDGVLGFHRLKPDDASLVLARYHNFRWNDPQVMVMAPFKYFDDKPFWQDEKEIINEQRRYEDIDEMRRVEEVKRWIVFKEKKLNVVETIGFQYQPRLYPLSMFKLPRPERVTKILSILETHPVLFDFLWVVVPSINISHPLLYKKSENKWLIRNIDGKMEVFDNDTDAAIALDYRLIQDNRLMPLLLAERDGKCYLIGLWR
jgi:hypothetical protein